MKNVTRTLLSLTTKSKAYAFPKPLRSCTPTPAFPRPPGDTEVTQSLSNHPRHPLSAVQYHSTFRKHEDFQCIHAVNMYMWKL